MLISALVKNAIKKSFYGKKIINILIIFFIFHKSNVKTFLKWIVKQYFKDTRQYFFLLGTNFSKSRLFILYYITLKNKLVIHPEHLRASHTLFF